jgi:hypothetical protein
MHIFPVPYLPRGRLSYRHVAINPWWTLWLHLHKRRVPTPSCGPAPVIVGLMCHHVVDSRAATWPGTRCHAPALAPQEAASRAAMWTGTHCHASTPTPRETCSRVAMCPSTCCRAPTPPRSGLPPPHLILSMPNANSMTCVLCDVACTYAAEQIRGINSISSARDMKSKYQYLLSQHLVNSKACYKNWHHTTLEKYDCMGDKPTRRIERNWPRTVMAALKLLVVMITPYRVQL